MMHVPNLMVYPYCSPILVGRRGVISSFKLFLPDFATRKGRGGGKVGSAPCALDEVKKCSGNVYQPSLEGAALPSLSSLLLGIVPLPETVPLLSRLKVITYVQEIIVKMINGAYVSSLRRSQRSVDKNQMRCILVVGTKYIIASGFPSWLHPSILRHSEI
jgi:hypothetical protein